MENVIWLVIVVTSIWVAVDAANLGARRGALGGGFFDMGVVAWFAACLFFWIVGFPAYLVTRSRYVERKRAVGCGPAAREQAPGFEPHFSGHPAFAAPAAPGAVVDDLSRLVALRDSGAVSQAEFEVLKARVQGQRAP